MSLRRPNLSTVTMLTSTASVPTVVWLADIGQNLCIGEVNLKTQLTIHDQGHGSRHSQGCKDHREIVRDAVYLSLV